MFRVVDIEQGTDGWLRWRQSGFTSTDAEILMGYSKRSYEDLFESKLVTEFEPFTNEYIEHGRESEPKARERFELATGYKFDPLCVESLVHQKVRSSLDGFNFELNIPLEIKCPFYYASYKKQVEKIPAYYYCQLQHHMLACGTEKILFYSFFKNSEVLHIVDADKDFQKELLYRYDLFQVCLEKKKIQNFLFPRYKMVDYPED